MFWKKSLSIVASVLLIFISACGALQGPAGGDGPGQDATSAIDTRVAEIIASTAAAQTAIANAVASTLTAMVTDTPESTITPTFTLTSSKIPTSKKTPTSKFTPSLSHTPTFTFTSSKTPTIKKTPTRTLTFTPKVPLVSVSVQTNCRVGPGTAYDVLGIMNVGQTAQVVGRSASSDNWIIKLPSKPAIICWLWGQYATVVGNTAGLPVIPPPPTPTPKYTPTLAASFLITYESFDYCGAWGGYYLKFKIVNNGSTTWDSFRWHLTDETLDITHVYYGGHFQNLIGCTVASSDDNLEPGETGFTTSVASLDNPTGHHFSAIVKICSGAQETGTCLEKTLTFTP